jgi:HEAT repeats/Caspase domain
MCVKRYLSFSRIVLVGIALGLLAGCQGYVSGVYAVRVYEEEGSKDKVAGYLNDRDPNVREEAVAALAKMGDCSLRLYAMYEDPNLHVRAALAKGLKYCNTNGAMAALQKLMEDTDSLVKKEAAEPAVNNDFCRDECMFGLRKLLEDSDPFVQLYAAKTLYKRFPEESRLIVIGHLTSKNYMVRKAAIEFLSFFKNAEDIYYLGDFLQDNDMTVRVLAQKSIEQILGRPASGEELSRIKAKERLPQSVQIMKGAGSSPQEPQSDAGLGNDMPLLSNFGLSKTGLADKDAIAVIIGNKDYKSVDIPDVAYALRDARIMKKVAQDVLGVPENNIIYIENAKTSDFNKIFGTANNAKGMLANWAKPTSKIFVYYSGHGKPISFPSTAISITSP